MTSQSASLARAITCASSKQSYLTAKLMVDKGLENDCYRAYGYFRWVDDVVDVDCTNRSERIAFIQRQITLADSLYRRVAPVGLCSEEEILADLIHNDRGENQLLRSYIMNFLAIIAFDAERKGRAISTAELDWYAKTLGKAVTDGIQYFVCNGHPYPDAENRYRAATAAHIAHMLRDLLEDVADGYINFPAEFLNSHQNADVDVNDPEFRSWVQERIIQARLNFGEGKKYLDSLAALRCKIVGYWYCARFERLLNAIERDDYVLRAYYPKALKFITWAQYFGMALEISGKHVFQRFHKTLVERFAQPNQKTCGLPRLATE